MRENKGITLIALVITIVVLIILAGLAISLSLGENGIFNKAKYATESYSNGQAKEEMEIAKLTNEIGIFTTRDNSLNKLDVLKDIKLIKEVKSTNGTRNETKVSINLDKGIYILFCDSAYSGGNANGIATSNNPKPEISGCEILNKLDDYISIIEIKQDNTNVECIFFKGLSSSGYTTFYRIAAYQ